MDNDIEIDRTLELTKAIKFNDIQAVVDHRVPIGPDHPFFTEFKDVRGDYAESEFYKYIFIDPRDYSYYNTKRVSKSIVFVAGHRGSGKTSEIRKWIKNIENPKGFYCIVCNIDEELDMNDVEYVDIMILQLEKLSRKLRHDGIEIEQSIFEDMGNWFAQRIKEMNSKDISEIVIETETKLGWGLPKFIEMFTKLKASITGRTENTEIVRRVIKNNFTPLAAKFSRFIEEVILILRKNHKADELLFVIDGIEKTNSPNLRKKIILEESNRIQQLKVNVVITLPIELMQEYARLKNFSQMFTFPFVKVIDKDGKKIEKAYKKFREFIYKRVDESLFEEEDVVDDIITYSGGSPRELLSILEQSAIQTEGFKITKISLQRAVKKLSSQYQVYVSKKDLEVLKEIHQNNLDGIATEHSVEVQDLLERHLIFEYNNGTYKRVNPLLECSESYKRYIEKK